MADPRCDVGAAMLGVAANIACCLGVIGAYPAYGSAPADSPPANSDPDDIGIPEDNVCGVNALYMLLKSWGSDVTPDQVWQATPRDTSGTSMLELKQAARRCGVETAVYECRTEDIGSHCVLPAIALMTNEGRAGWSSREFPGHYVLVLSVDDAPDGNVHWLDGTYGFRFTRPKATFDRWYRGYVLTRDRSSAPRMWILAGVNTLLWVAAFWWLHRTAGRHSAAVSRGREGVARPGGLMVEGQMLA